MAWPNVQGESKDRINRHAGYSQQDKLTTQSTRRSHLRCEFNMYSALGVGLLIRGMQFEEAESLGIGCRSLAVWTGRLDDGKLFVGRESAINNQKPAPLGTSGQER